jgi:hypothetical protein
MSPCAADEHLSYENKTIQNEHKQAIQSLQAPSLEFGRHRFIVEQLHSEGKKGKLQACCSWKPFA